METGICQCIVCKRSRFETAAPDMLTALETILSTARLSTGEQAIVANAIAKATGKSIDEVVKAGA
jgi:hypothetical protein